jgi:O-antigen ligase
LEHPLTCSTIDRTGIDALDVAQLSKLNRLVGRIAMCARVSLGHSDWCARAVEAGWLAAAVGVPLAFNPLGGSGFELPKAALLRALVLLMGLAALVQFIDAWGDRGRSALRWPDTPLVWPVLAFGLALALATALSVNPRVSLWGSYERQQGLLTLGAFLALFLLTAAGLRTRAQAERLWAALVWGSAPVVAYGLVQAVGLDPLDWQTDASSAVLSTVGRANFLGSYLVLVVPLTLGRALVARRRWTYAPLLAGQLFALACTQARGAWVGLGTAALLFGLAWALTTQDRRLALTLLAVGMLAVGVVAVLNWADSPLAYLAEIPGLDRLGTLAATDTGSTAARLTIWRTTTPLILARPWLGYGPETMRPVFASVFPPQLVYYQGRHATVDRAHNLWLDLGISVGLLGIVAFAALLVGFGRSAWRGLRSSSDRWSRVAWVALAAAVAGHLADLQFGFDLTASATVFWLTLALSAALGRGLSPSALKKTSPPRLAALLLYAAPAVAVLALVGMLCLRPLVADAAYWRSQQGTDPLEQRLSAGRQAVELWPLESEYRLGLAWVLVQSGQFSAAEAQLGIADGLSPHDPEVWAARGELYAIWGDLDSARYSQAEAAYRQALELAPNVATYHTALGLVLASQGRLEEGVVALERAVDLDATDGIAYGHLADLYLALGRDTEAVWAQREGERWSEVGGEG